MEVNIMQKLSVFKLLMYLFLIFHFASHTTESAKLRRAIMMSMGRDINFNCTDLTITEKNSSTSIILSGTVTACNVKRAGIYKCSIQVWRVMKGQKLAKDLVTVQQTSPTFSFYRKTFVDVYGLGNRAYCHSNVKNDDTRIFFLNRSNDRLVLSASLLRITLTNLQNTQDVIDGKKIVEVPKKPIDPCLMVLCGFGAHCEAVDGRPNCVCPEVSCGGVADPVCGSDGVTYPNDCRLKAAECLAQKRIVVASENSCATAPDPDPCNSVECGFGAVCVLHTDENGGTGPACECPTCDGVLEGEVCGSDQRTYSSECALLRISCLETRNISVVRRSPCNMCGGPDQCPGFCSYDDVTKEAVCCGKIPCTDLESGLVCGSDGVTYESECAMQRFGCKTGRKLEVVQTGKCPPKRAMTKAVGSVSLQAGPNCPGRCNPKDSRFKRFISKFESSVNQKLSSQNQEDLEGRMMEKFRVVDVRRGSVVLIFEVHVSTVSRPIGVDQKPDEATDWINTRLFSDTEGAIIESVEDSDLWLTEDFLSTVFVEDEDATRPGYKTKCEWRETDLVGTLCYKQETSIADVCLNLQCHHFSACSVRTAGRALVPSCSCDAVGDGGNMAVDTACTRATDKAGQVTVFPNKVAARKQSCDLEMVYTFKDGCTAESDPCKGIGGCKGPGEVCMMFDTQPSCGCVTCEEIVDPVCGGDGKTYRSECELNRMNCLHHKHVQLQSVGVCGNLCDDVTCDFGAQCEVTDGRTECVCPAACSQLSAPVCGSDCVTYNNKCEMQVESCKSKVDIYLLHRGACRSTDECSGSGDVGSGEGSGPESEGSAEPCSCKFGATCDPTANEVDTNCVCSFSCNERPLRPVCGSDGVSYSSMCEIEEAQCEQQKSITVAKHGRCDAVEEAQECQCNPYGSLTLSCDPFSGRCTCRPGVGGLHCDRCDPGFWDFRALVESPTSGCTACGCHANGSTRDDCDQMTGQCKCEEGVMGLKCDECKEEGAVMGSSGCAVPLPTTSATTTVSLPVDEVETSGLGDCGQSDDEDCVLSGDDHEVPGSKLETTIIEIDVSSSPPPPTTTTTTTTVSTTSTHISKFLYKMSGVFLTVGGSELSYSDDLLRPDSDKFIEYTEIITTRMNEYLSNPNLAGKVKSFVVDSYTEYSSYWYGNGVYAHFLIDLESPSVSSDVQNELNQVSNREHTFEITEASTTTMPVTGLQSPEALKMNQTFYREGPIWSIPQFGGSSYQEYAPVSALTTTTIRIRFRSFDSEGLLFFSAQDQSGTDFVSIAIRDGRVEFRFDTGSGAFLLVSYDHVNDSEWHDVLARRNRRDGMLVVDEKKPLHGTSPPGTIGLDINSSLFVGGVSQKFEVQVQQQAFISKGLTGCIHSISVQDKKILLTDKNRDRITAYRISECSSSPCFPNLCKNSADCFIKKLDEVFTTKCNCKKGFEGEMCSNKSDPCASLNCHPSSSCRKNLGKSFVCVCPSERFGDRCQHETSQKRSLSEMPAFAGDSYLLRKSMGEEVKHRMVVKVTFYASQNDGLIFYNGQTDNRGGEFVALYLMKKHLIFSFDLGGEIVKIKSNQLVSTDAWHEVHLTRDYGTGQMSIDGASPDVGESQSGFSELDLKGPLFLGGVPSEIKTPFHSRVVKGLIGALQKFQFNGVDVSLLLSKNSLDQYNVQPFNAHPCYHNPCSHGGTCIPRLGDYRCLCAEGGSGQHCDGRD